MSVTQNIVRTYRGPRAVIRDLLSLGHHEGRALTYLMVACFVVFIGQWPRLQREAMTNPDAPPLEGQLMATFFAWVLFAPLIFYGIAALSHLVAKIFGGKGTWFGARLALFWTMLAVSPLMLLNGLVTGFFPQGAERAITGGLLTLAFFAIWLISLAEAERADAPEGQA